MVTHLTLVQELLDCKRIGVEPKHFQNSLIFPYTIDMNQKKPYDSGYTDMMNISNQTKGEY